MNNDIYLYPSVFFSFSHFRWNCVEIFAWKASTYRIRCAWSSNRFGFSDLRENLSVGWLRVVSISGSTAESILIRAHDEIGDSYPFVHSGYWILSCRSDLLGSRSQRRRCTRRRSAIRIGSLSLLRSLSSHSVGNNGDLAIIGSICAESLDGCHGNSPEHGDGGRRSNHTLITYNLWSA